MSLLLSLTLSRIFPHFALTASDSEDGNCVAVNFNDVTTEEEEEEAEATEDADLVLEEVEGAGFVLDVLGAAEVDGGGAAGTANTDIVSTVLGKAAEFFYRPF